MKRLFEGLPIQRALAWDHVVVLAAGDVFDVEVPDAVVQELDGVGDGFADDLAVADVEIGAEARMFEAVDPVAQLGDVFEIKSRLTLDADVDVELISAVEDGADGFGELFGGGLGRHAAEQPA